MPTVRIDPMLKAWLDVIGVPWRPPMARWYRWLACARAYREEHGHLLVPVNHRTRDGETLGHWIAQQRRLYWRGELSEERIALLNELGMVWRLRYRRRRNGGGEDRTLRPATGPGGHEGWTMPAVEAARAYYEEHGNLWVPRGYVTRDGMRLGKWIARQRALRNKGALPPEQIAELDELGMVWDPNQERWQRKLACARAYHKEHGHLLVPVNHKTRDGEPLGRWLADWRSLRNQGRLPDDRKQELDKLGMVWNLQGYIRERRRPRPARENRVQREPPIVRESQMSQHARSPTPGRPGRQRASLSPLSRLESVWSLYYQAACEFRAAHGHLRIPVDYRTPAGLPLGRWLSRQRADYRVGGLTQRRIELLEQLGISWGRGRRAQPRWETFWEAARAYREEHGNLRVPENHETPDGIALGKWLAAQRTLYRSGDMPPERIVLLDEIDNEWRYPRQTSPGAWQAVHEDRFEQPS